MILRSLAHHLASVVASRTLTAPDRSPGVRLPVEGGHPAEDMPGTWRIDKGDNPADRTARRWIKDDSGMTPWTLVTGWNTKDAPASLDDDDMIRWSRVCGPPPR